MISTSVEARERDMVRLFAEGGPLTQEQTTFCQNHGLIFINGDRVSLTEYGRSYLPLGPDSDHSQCPDDDNYQHQRTGEPSMKHNPKTVEFLHKFCDGTELGPFELDELKAAGLILSDSLGHHLTAYGNVVLKHPEIYQQAAPLGEDSSQCPDDDSYLPPKRWNPETSALDRQVQGTHYKDHAIQPIEYIHANKLGYIEGNVVKYITRHTSKGGAGDVRKAIHCWFIA